MIEHVIQIQDQAEHEFRKLKDALETINSSQRTIVEAVCQIDDWTMLHEGRRLTTEELIDRYKANFPDATEPSQSRISKARITTHAFRLSKKSWGKLDAAGFRDSEVLYYVGQALLPEVGKSLDEILDAPENGGMPRSRRDAKAWLDMHKGKDPDAPTDRVQRQAQEAMQRAAGHEVTPKQVRETLARVLLEKWPIIEVWLREEAGDQSAEFKEMLKVLKGEA